MKRVFQSGDSLSPNADLAAVIAVRTVAATCRLVVLAMSAVVFGLSGSTALAGDLPGKAPITSAPRTPSWVGFYSGLSVGGHWGRDGISTTGNQQGFVGPGLDTLSSASLSPGGFIGGIQAGYNWQVDRIVVGVEADASWVTGSSSRNLVYPGPTPAAGDVQTNSVGNRFLGTVRARLGAAVDRTLIYATGGVAFGSLRFNESMCIQGCPGTAAAFASAQTTITRTGWAAGGGVEHELASNWTAKLEYLYVDLGRFDTIIPSATGCAGGLVCDIAVHHKYSDQVLRTGLNYRF